MIAELPRVVNLVLGAVVVGIALARWRVIREQPRPVRAVLLIGLAYCVAIGYATAEILALPGTQPTGARVYVFIALNTLNVIALARARPVTSRPLHIRDPLEEP